jgi:DNA-binding transcriptional LysR family regulator
LLKRGAFRSDAAAAHACFNGESACRRTRGSARRAPLDRSTRALRFTDLGSEVLEHARHSSEASEAIENIVSNQRSDVTGTLRLSAPPNISDTLLSPLVTAFQTHYPNVRVQILIAERHVDHIGDGVDMVLRLGTLKESLSHARF